MNTIQTSTGVFSKRPISLVRHSNGKVFADYADNNLKRAQLKKIEDQFLNYEGEPSTLVIIFRNESDYRVYSDRRQIRGSLFIGGDQIKKAIKKAMKTL